MGSRGLDADLLVAPEKITASRSIEQVSAGANRIGVDDKWAELLTARNSKTLKYEFEHTGQI
jgi:uroporphyrinogen-III decarboxylase